MASDAADLYRQSIEKKIEVAINVATPLALAGNFAAAEEIVREAERSLSERVGVARMYVSIIKSLGGIDAQAGDRERILAMFQRLLFRPMSSHPAPHTQEEANRYGEEDDREHARVVRLVGFDPYQWPAVEPVRDKAGTTTREQASSNNRKSNSVLTSVAAVACILVGLLFTSGMLVMFFAGGANSSPIQIRQIKMLIASVIFVQMASLGGAFALLIIEKGWLSCGAGLIPALYGIILTIVLFYLEW